MHRNRGWLVVCVAIGFVWSGAGAGPVVGAEPPRIGALTPGGVRRGVATEVVVTGANLAGHPRWLSALPALVEPLAGSDAGAWRVRVAPDPDAPVGIYYVRVQTDDGVSGSVPIAVDQVPHVAEVEENGTFAAAQRVEAPVVVEGKVAGADVDCFRFAGRRGDRVVIDARCARLGSVVDPSIRLSTARRRLVASADDTPGLVTDARFCAELPADGDYVVELADGRYQGAGPRPTYHLLIGLGLPAAGSVFPLGGVRGESTRFELAGGTLLGASPHPIDLILDPLAGRSSGDAIPVAVRLAAPAIDRGEWVASGGWRGVDVEGLPPLIAGDAPEYREPVDPAAPPVRAASLPATFHGRIEAPGDSDSFVVPVTPGGKIRVAVQAASLGSRLDGVFQIRTSQGAVLASADDSPLPIALRPKPLVANDPKKVPVLLPDPELIFVAPADRSEVTVHLRDLSGDGGPDYPYRLTVAVASPGFDLALTTSDPLNIPRGGTAAVGVEVDRRDFAGPIALKVAGPLPPGVTVRPGLVPAGQTLGALTVACAPGVAFDATRLQVHGEAIGPDGPLVVAATRTTVHARQADFATSFTVDTGLLAAPTSPSLVTLAGPDAVEVVLGYPATIPVRAVRLAAAEDTVLTFSSLPTIANLAVAADPKLAAKATEGAVTLNTNPDLAPGPVVVVLQARGKVGDRDRTFILPALTLNVVRPADVELLAPRVELAAGGSVEAKGRITRRGPFREPVTVALDNLPAGLKADPVVVPPDRADFALAIHADPRAAPTEASARVKLTYKLGPRDYAPPPTPWAIRVTAPTPTNLPQPGETPR